MFNKKVKLGSREVGTGWIRSLPDMRDYDTSVIEKKVGINYNKPLPTIISLAEHFSHIDNQGDIGSCTAHAATGIVEYFQRKAFGKHMEGSRRFVYKVTRNLMQETGDTGAYLRNAMGALVMFGVPDEKYFPYTDAKEKLNEEPSAFVYGMADNFEALEYFCHDPLGARKSGSEVLSSVKTYIAAGIPSMFGFYGFPSFGSTNTKGGIPFPGNREKAQWGHAIVACGYDDTKKVNNTQTGMSTIGALQIRNSWGKEWGNKGYGWLPYDYVTSKLADDFWSLVSMEWIDTGQFGL